MRYQALYRAWRPETFSQIVGQDAVVRTLRHQVETGRVAHAIPVLRHTRHGQDHRGQSAFPRHQLPAPVDGDPCGECDVCLQLKKENSMDVIEIDAASNNGVDEIRDLREKVKYPPAVAKYKVYIIDEVHMLSTGAFNALLKTLEEPPAHAVFILATTEPQRLPATILSRCQRFDFRRLSVETMVERMMVVLGGIGRTASDEALHEIARAAEGAMRDALSILDVCLSYTDGEVELALVRDVLGTAGREFLFDFAAALLSCDARSALLQIDELLRRGLDPQVFAREVAEHLRALLLAQTVGEATEELLECTPEDAQRYREQAGTAVREQLFRLMELFMRVEPDMKWAADPRAMLELTAVRACCPQGGEGRFSRRARWASGSGHRAGRGRRPGEGSAQTCQGPRARQGARPQGRAAAQERRRSAAAVFAGGGGAFQGQPLDARGAGGHEVRGL